MLTPTVSYCAPRHAAKTNTNTNQTTTCSQDTPSFTNLMHSGDLQPQQVALRYTCRS